MFSKLLTYMISNVDANISWVNSKFMICVNGECAVYARDTDKTYSIYGV